MQHQQQQQQQQQPAATLARALPAPRLALALLWGFGGVFGGLGLPNKIRSVLPVVGGIGAVLGMTATEDALFRSIEVMQKSAKKPWWVGGWVGWFTFALARVVLSLVILVTNICYQG